MYVRLVEFSGADEDKHEQVVETMRENIVPTLRGFEGFRGFIGLYDGASGRAKAVLLWDDKETAEKAEEELYDRRRRIAGGLGLSVESEDLYEASVVALEGAPA
jgi:hypothetical protein